MMRPLTDDDLVYCTIKILVAPTDVSKVPQNDQYIVAPERGPSHKQGGPRPWNTRSATPESDYTTLAMTIDPDSMKHPRSGHLFGSDSRDCDVLLDTTNANGIGGVHFRLDLVLGEDEPQMLWIVNMSTKATLEIAQTQLSYGQQVALKPRLTNRVQAGLVVFDIVSADRHFEPAALSKLEAARGKAHGALGLRRLKKLRKETPRFSPKLTGWNTFQNIPWQSGGAYKLFNTVLGVGRYSTVRKARRQVPDHQTVAVKIIGAGVIAGERRSNRELQENELRIMLELEHVNIVRLVDFAVYDAAPFATLLALERATHGTLRDVFLARVDEGMCRTVTSQVLAGLQYLHKQNIIHRDINPENILVFDNDPAAFYCKLSDFTHARKVTLDDLPGDVQGTPSFMSLECAEGEPCDQRADIFACGKVAFWLLKGEEDLANDNLSVHVGSALDHIAAHLKTWDREASLHSLGASHLCINLLKSMLTNSLSQRPSAVRCLSHKWFAASTLSSPDVELGCTVMVHQTTNQFPGTQERSAFQLTVG
ncbi:hypothetical protein B0A54_17549 [Friedmanniomyces endolithicus]|uniref:non-specific serine/threonine protein kinase n=1 Tax=Friedmanniomyces endolithicus TaxID=329885 RepID=A0A4U0TSL1_9PEZI|nr:hypothetical protein B0A54_17549 [Friedmanniomyces endolithicus]